MKYGKEIKVGATVVAVGAIFVFGTRFFQDKPFFSGSHAYYTTFEDAGGIVSGNAVRINGVNVGSVTDITLVEEAARIDFTVASDIPLPRGTVATVGGAALFGVTRLTLALGPRDAPPHERGDRIPGEGGDDLGRVMGSAPALVDRTDSLIAGTTAAVEAARRLLDSPESDLRSALSAIEGTASALTALLQAERERLADVLEGIRSAAGSVDALVRDSLAATAARVNVLIERLDGNLQSLEQTTTSLNTLLVKLNEGEGTFGRLFNDDSLYVEINGAVGALRRILEDFERDPKKYLNELTLVELF